MSNYVTGGVIKKLREKKKLNQKQLAQMLCVSDKTVSKWETGRGFPDISLLEPLAAVLGVSLTELISGDCVSNANPSSNVLRGKWYVCPVCGNVVWAVGEGTFSCCGLQLLPQTTEEPCPEHEIHVQKSDGQWYVKVEHPMSRQHSIRFLACVTCDRLQLVHLYPEQNAQAHFSICGSGVIYAFCNRHGLFRVRI